MKSYLQKLLSKLNWNKGSKNIEEALWNLVLRTKGELNKRDVFIARDNDGYYYADVNKPSRGRLLGSFAAPF